jgi:hypothetical protein
MIKINQQITGFLRRSSKTGVAVLLFFIAVPAFSQEPPPRPVVVTFNSAQPLAFGAFSPGAAGGTVTVAPNGTRTAGGSVVLLSLGYAYTPAMFNVKTNQGTVLSILATPPVILTGSGGGTLSLQISGSLPASPFVTTIPWPQLTTVLVGGILTIGNIASNPPGNYTGTFNITVIRE